jgi:hypothetical protein
MDIESLYGRPPINEDTDLESDYRFSELIRYAFLISDSVDPIRTLEWLELLYIIRSY